MRTVARSIFLVLGLLLVTTTCFARQDRPYVVFDVPGATSTHPVSINNNGDVTGWYSTIDGNKRGFVREFDGTLTTFDGVPTNINDAGAITGYLSVSNWPPYPSLVGFVRDQDGKITLFEIKRKETSYAAYITFGSAINNQGEIAGFFLDDSMSDLPHGFIRDRQGSMTF